MPRDFPDRTRSEWRFAAFVVLSGLAVALIYQFNLWRFDENDFSILSDRLPYWDFTNLWAGSRMALEGRVDLLFDTDAYRAALRNMFSPELPNQEWSYPPSIIMLGAPFGLLPIWLAYGIWTLGTIALLHLALRPLKFPLLVQLAVLSSPAVVMNAIFGQNGSLTAALLIGGLMLAPRRPIVAGVLFGILTVKPHLGVLIPICLLASANWRAFLAAAATAVGLVAVTALTLGFDSWLGFINETQPLMTAIMEADYPQLYHANALTVFIMARSFGAGVDVALAAQLCATLAAIVFVAWLWLPSTIVDHPRRVVLTAALALISTPYGYTYDAVPMCVAVAFIFMSTERPRLALLGFAWLFPYMVHLLNFQGIGIGVLVPAALAGWMGVDCVQRHRRGARGEPAERSRRAKMVVAGSR